MEMLHWDKLGGPSLFPLFTSSMKAMWMATANLSASTLPCYWVCGQVTFLGTRRIQGVGEAPFSSLYPRSAEILSQDWSLRAKGSGVGCLSSFLWHPSVPSAPEAVTNTGQSPFPEDHDPLGSSILPAKIYPELD